VGIVCLLPAEDFVAVGASERGRESWRQLLYNNGRQSHFALQVLFEFRVMDIMVLLLLQVRLLLVLVFLLLDGFIVRL